MKKVKIFSKDTTNFVVKRALILFWVLITCQFLHGQTPDPGCIGFPDGGIDCDLNCMKSKTICEGENVEIISCIDPNFNVCPPPGKFICWFVKKGINGNYFPCKGLKQQKEDYETVGGDFSGPGDYYFKRCVSCTQVCVQTNCTTEDVKITVKTGPSINITALPSGCQTVLTAEVTGGIIPYNYLWSLGGATTPSITVFNSAVYSVIVTDDAGCSSTAFYTVVKSNPVVKIEGKNQICVGDTDTLKAAVTGGVPPLSFKWSNGQTEQQIMVMSAGTYKVTVNDGAGCSANSSITVQVNPLPVVAIVPAGPASFCMGNSLNLTATLNFSSYQWKKDNVDIPGAIGKSYPATLSGNYSLKATDLNACSNVSNSVMIDVKGLPVVEVNANKVKFCEGEPIEFSSNGGISYSWSGPNGFMNTQQNFTIKNAEANMSGVYTVTVTNSDGCTNLAKLTIQVFKFPDATIKSNSPLCSNQDLLLSVSSGTNYIYQWSGPNGFTSNAQNPKIPDVISSGNYFVTVTNNGCISNGNTNVVVNTRPKAIVNYATTGGSLYEIISESNQGDKAIVSLNFDFSDTNVKDSLIFTNNPVLTFERKIFNSTGLELIVTDAAGCADTAWQNIVIQAASCKYKLKDPTNKICGSMKYESLIEGESLNLSLKYEIEWKLFDLSNNQLLLSQKKQLDNNNFSDKPPYFPNDLKIVYNFNTARKL